MTYNELDRYRQLVNRIYYIEVELRELAELSAVRLDGMPHSRTPGDPVYQAFIKAEKLRQKLEFQKRQAVDELQKLNDFIESIADEELKNIFKARFVKGDSYEKISEQLNCDRRTVSRKIKKYLNYF